MNLLAQRMGQLEGGSRDRFERLLGEPGDPLEDQASSLSEPGDSSCLSMMKRDPNTGWSTPSRSPRISSTPPRPYGTHGGPGPRRRLSSTSPGATSSAGLGDDLGHHAERDDRQPFPRRVEQPRRDGRPACDSRPRDRQSPSREGGSRSFVPAPTPDRLRPTGLARGAICDSRPLARLREVSLHDLRWVFRKSFIVPRKPSIASLSVRLDMRGLRAASIIAWSSTSDWPERSEWSTFRGR